MDKRDEGYKKFLDDELTRQGHEEQADEAFLQTLSGNDTGIMLTPNGEKRYGALGVEAFNFFRKEYCEALKNGPIENLEAFAEKKAALFREAKKREWTQRHPGEEAPTWSKEFPDAYGQYHPQLLNTFGEADIDGTPDANFLDCFNQFVVGRHQGKKVNGLFMYTGLVDGEWNAVALPKEALIYHGHSKLDVKDSPKIHALLHEGSPKSPKAHSTAEKMDFEKPFDFAENFKINVTGKTPQEIEVAQFFVSKLQAVIDSDALSHYFNPVPLENPKWLDGEAHEAHYIELIHTLSQEYLATHERPNPPAELLAADVKITLRSGRYSVPPELAGVFGEFANRINYPVALTPEAVNAHPTRMTYFFNFFRKAYYDALANHDETLRDNPELFANTQAKYYLDHVAESYETLGDKRFPPQETGRSIDQLDIQGTPDEGFFDCLTNFLYGQQKGRNVIGGVIKPYQAEPLPLDALTDRDLGSGRKVHPHQSSSYPAPHASSLLANYQDMVLGGYTLHTPQAGEFMNVLATKANVTVTGKKMHDGIGLPGEAQQHHQAFGV